MAILIVCVFLIVVAACGLMCLFHHMEVELLNLHARLNELEAAQKSKVRNPYMTNIGIEDAIAIVLDLKNTAEYADLRSKTLHEILRQIRTDPTNYNDDRPNGKRDIGGEK